MYTRLSTLCSVQNTGAANDTDRANTRPDGLPALCSWAFSATVRMSLASRLSWPAGLCIQVIVSVYGSCREQVLLVSVSSK